MVILSLGWHPNWSFGFEILFLRASDQVSTHLLQRLHVAAGEGDPNPVNGHHWLHRSRAGIFKGHGAARLPDCLVLWRECTAVRQEQEQVAPSSTAEATVSSSKSLSF